MSVDNVKGILFDLDGVLYVGEDLIDGAADTLDFCRQQRLPFRFITNTSTKSISDVAQKLGDFGLDIRPGEIFSAVSATREFLRKQGKPSVHLLIRESAKSDFAEFPKSEKPDYVVVGDIGAAWNYELLNRVFRELMNGAELIAMHMNKFWQSGDGLQMDIGAFVAGLEFVSGKKARVIGKPSADFFALALSSLALPAEQVLIVGDDIDNDIGGGQAAGLQGVLVKTGKYRKAYADACEVTPMAIIESIADLPALLGSAGQS